MVNKPIKNEGDKRIQLRIVKEYGLNESKNERGKSEGMIGLRLKSAANQQKPQLHL